MQNAELESLSHVTLWQGLLAKIPVAAYTCDSIGRLTYFNALAEAVWGRPALLRDSAQRYCGSYRMYAPDGALVPHDQCWMARALLEGRPYNGYEVVIEQENGTRIFGLAYANPIRNPPGQIIGAVNLVIPKTSQVSLSSDPTAGRAAEVDGAALAMADVALGLFAHAAWPTEAFS